MKTRTLFVSVVLFGVAAWSVPARAWWFEDGEGWAPFTFHRYGGDVNRPGATPDRPYWHGDDAVPLGLRWQDLEAAEAQAAAADAAVVAAAAVEVHGTTTRPLRAHRVYRKRVSRPVAKNDCVPVLVPRKQ